MDPTAHPLKASALRRLTRRWLTSCIPLAALTVGACSPYLSFDGAEATPERLFSVGYRNLAERYIDPIDLGIVTVAGLAKLHEIDPKLNVVASGGNVVLTSDDTPSGEWRSPSKYDALGWARVTSEALDAARAASTAARGKPEGDLSDAVFLGVMSKLDRYSRYANPERARHNRAARDGFGGLGISIKLEDGATHIVKIHPGTPAEKAGLKSKDRITHVDDQPIQGLSQREVISILRGPRNSSVVLRIERNKPAIVRRFTVVRARIVLPTVTATRSDGLLILRITGFNQGTSTAVGRELSRAERTMGRDLKGIILDLRGNPGGLLDQAVSVSDLFLGEGLILSTQGRHPRSQQIFDASWGEMMAGVPLALLVNGKSASAAEIVAVALRDRGRAVVIGSSSYGKGTVQTIIGLPNGGELTMTWARMHAPSGFAIQGHGIIPAICTSGDQGSLTTLVASLRAGGGNSAGLLAGQLQARLKRRMDPKGARQACPPKAAEPEADMQIAGSLLLNRPLYQKALADGRPAVAERPTSRKDELTAP